MSRHLYLSPHLDDVALSCGGRVARASREGIEVEILTVFAGDEPERPASLLVDRVFALWALPRGAVMSSRREEDRAAGSLLGATPIHWDELEAIHRREPRTNEPLYPSLARLFGPVAAVEAPLVERLAARLRSLPKAGLVVAPLGVGGHADHRLLRAAAELAFGSDLAYYEEFPYVVWKLFALRRARGSRRGWRSDSLPLDDSLKRVKRAAILAYRSQIDPLFGNERRLDRLLARHAHAAGGERLWARRSTGSSAAR